MDLGAARRLVELAPQVDILVGAGDFGSMRRGIGVCLDLLRIVERPAVLVAGNNESTEELTEACRDWPQAQVLHGSGITIAGQSFHGVGGGIPVTPFGAWSYDFSEEQATELLADSPTGSVLICHSPPHGTVDRDSRGLRRGSTAVRAAVERTRPVLVVCGHIHDSARRQGWIGSSPVVNAGPRGIIWDLEIGASLDSLTTD
jgi:Icc-related predicted phosphoesterase